MVCKFAPKKFGKTKVVCEFYNKNAPTCQLDDGGPFVGKLAYCGHHNTLSGVQRERKRLMAKPLLMEA